MLKPHLTLASFSPFLPFILLLRHFCFCDVHPQDTNNIVVLKSQSFFYRSTKSPFLELALHSFLQFHLSIWAHVFLLAWETCYVFFNLVTNCFSWWLILLSFPCLKILWFHPYLLRIFHWVKVWFGIFFFNLSEFSTFSTDFCW